MGYLDKKLKTIKTLNDVSFKQNRTVRLTRSQILVQKRHQ